MRNFVKPPKYVKLLAKAAKYYNIEIIYSHPKNVDINKEVINGLTLQNNEWCDVEISAPEYIDLNSYCYKYKNVIAFLKKEKHIIKCKRFWLETKALQYIAPRWGICKIYP